MSNCYSDGDLRAFLDGELPGGGEHIESCAVCAARLQEIEARARRVGACLAGLTDSPAIAVERPRRRRAWGWVAAAATILAALGLAPWGTERAPKPSPAPTTIASVMAPAAPPVQPSVAPPVVAASRPVRHRAKPRPASTYYLALDDQPIETGLIVRVALENGLQADVIVDSDGHPRAIRPVNFSVEGEPR